MNLEEAGHRTPSTERGWLLTRLVRMNRYLLLLLLIPAGIIYFWPDWGKQEQAQQRLSELKVVLNQRQVEASTLKRNLGLIKNDPAYLEVMARDKLGMQKDGEYILHFKD